MKCVRESIMFLCAVSCGLSAEKMEQSIESTYAHAMPPMNIIDVSTQYSAKFFGVTDDTPPKMATIATYVETAYSRCMP